MLELGNKKTQNRTYKQWFTELGFRHVSVDINGQDGALPLDLTQPINLGTFDMVTNIGTSEHVDVQEPVWRNMFEALDVGSVLIAATPLIGDWEWHGRWYPSDTFYRVMALLNRLEIERMYIYGTSPRKLLCCRLRRLEPKEFVWVPGLIYDNGPSQASAIRKHLLKCATRCSAAGSPDSATERPAGADLPSRAPD